MSATSSYITRKEISKSGLWQKRGPRLPRLDIELTERCNNNCIHCYINRPKNDGESQRREMDAKKIKQILAEAAALGCMTVRFTGGEPLLRPDFTDIYLHARRLGIKVILFTNGTLITEELIALFKRYPPGEPVSITLYGMTLQAYETVSRVNRSFAAAMKGIDLLLEHSIPLSLKNIHLAGRGEETEAFRIFSETRPGLAQSGGTTLKFNLRGRRDNSRKNDIINTIRLLPLEIIEILTRDRHSYLKDKKQFIAQFMHPGGVNLFTCGCGKGGSVDAYGYLQPCLLMRHPELVYDLGRGTIEDALLNYFPKVLNRQAENPTYLKRCARCFLKGLCDQCPAWSYMENGTLDSPVEYLCNIAHEEARYLGLLKTGEKAWEVDNWQERIARFVNGSE